VVAEISVLVEGYARELEGGVFRASPSSVLIEDSGMRILADPGADGESLLCALYREGLSPQDVDIIFVTHPHLDHILNLRLFPQAEVCDPTFVYRGDELIPYGKFIPETGIEVLATPGHTPDHGSLLVPVEGETWLVAGDLFWWRDGAVPKTDVESLLAQEDELACDPPALRASRLAALERADVVIPGHGKVFRPAGRPRPGLR
jgi:glyoxylase-like metal-dependent hydrolase (beta-lactamase superfamily II)